MALANYTDLVSALSADGWFMGRNLSTQAPDFITLAEGYFNTALRVREMEAVTTLSPTSNVYTLPTDYIEYKRVVEDASTRRRLDYITEDAVDALYPNREGGLSNHFTIIGSSLYTYPLSSNDVELTYYQRIPALTSGNATNWLMTKMPNLYLHGALMQAALFVVEDEMAARETALVKLYVDQLNAADQRGKFGNAGVTLPGNVW